MNWGDVLVYIVLGLCAIGGAVSILVALFFVFAIVRNLFVKPRPISTKHTILGDFTSDRFLDVWHGTVSSSLGDLRLEVVEREEQPDPDFLRKVRDLLPELAEYDKEARAAFVPEWEEQDVHDMKDNLRLVGITQQSDGATFSLEYDLGDFWPDYTVTVVFKNREVVGVMQGD